MTNKSNTTLRIVMVGDVIITEAIDPEKAFGNALPILQEGDLTLANVEGVICDDTISTLPGKTESGSGGHVRMPSGPIESILKLAKVDAVSTAEMSFPNRGPQLLIWDRVCWLLALLLEASSEDRVTARSNRTLQIQ